MNIIEYILKMFINIFNNIKLSFITIKDLIFNSFDSLVDIDEKNLIQKEQNQVTRPQHNRMKRQNSGCVFVHQEKPRVIKWNCSICSRYITESMVIYCCNDLLFCTLFCRNEYQKNLLNK